MNAVQQQSLLASGGDGGDHDVSVPEQFELPEADVTLDGAFLEPADADRLFEELSATTPWRQETLEMYGRRIPVPRLSSWHADEGIAYTYSGITHAGQPWTAALAEVRKRAEDRTGHRFNSVLANLYRDGRDSVSWHADDEPELGPEPVIASVSLGSVRRFQLRHVETGERHDLELPHGSLLLMAGPTQRCWRHQLPKTSASVGPRINLTFRLTR